MDIVFTEERLKALTPPAKGEITYGDVKTPGLRVRVQAGGAKTYYSRYRVGGRGSRNPRLTWGEVGVLPLAEARKLAVGARAAVAKGRDLAGERKAARAAAARAAKGEEKPTLAALIDAHEKDQAARGVVSAARAAKSLGKEFKTLLDRAPASLTRADIVKVLDFVRDGEGDAPGRPGLVPTLKAWVNGLLAWAENAGHVPHNVMAGFRSKRRSRAERLATLEKRAGDIMLDMAEIAALWRACDDQRVRPSFGAYIKLLILTGCRRGEMAQAQLSWIKPATTDRLPLLVIPAKVTKPGREHAVPLTALAQGVIASVKRFADTDLLTPGARSRAAPGKTAPISGWSKSWPALLKVAEDYGLTRKPALHELRKTFRSHLARLGVADRVAEAMLNHAPTDRLIGIYDKHDYLAERIEAAERWAAEVSQALAEPPRGAADIVALRPAQTAARGRQKGAAA
jgi:integrase